jgi:thiamine kinase-like enzyme
MSPPIVAPEAITAAWLTAVLAAGGVRARVRNFVMRLIGTGQIGQSVRFELDYDAAPDGAPRALVGKFPAPEPDSRNAGVVLGNYRREINFYNRLAPTALVATPYCYFAAIDETTHDFVLMMEDLAPAEPGNQLAGCTVEQARLVVREAAKLHASHWDDARIEAFDWVSGTRAAGGVGSADPGALKALWDAFCARYGERVEADARRVGDRLIERYDRYESFYAGPKSLVHIDFRPDNMMFATLAGGRPITVLDWQSLAFGCGVTDVAYFLAGALGRDDRRRLERELLGEYHQQLAELGVRYDPEQLWTDYRSRAFSLLLVAFYASMMVNRTDRGDDMFMAMVRSSTDQVLDLESLALLD